MAINIKTVTCPACGAKVNYDENNKIARCEFCGAVLDMTEQYGEKKDRERDDMQDEQLRTIMNRMHVRNTGNNDPNIRKAKRTALIIIICLVVFGFMSTIIFSTVGAMRFSNAIKEETTKVIDTDINPFDKLTIKYTGVSGNAVGRLDDKDIHGISTLKKITSDLEKLSNGDTITVKYPQDSYKDGNTIYHFTETEKTYTVRGLDEYVTDINEIGEEDLAALKKNAIDKAIFECKDDNFPYVEDSFEIYAVYTMVKKDFTKQTSVFIVSFDYTDDKSKETKTGYFMAEYSNITKLGDGSFKINFNAGGFNYSRESYLGGFTVISAHSTWDAVYTDVYLNNKAEWSIHEDFMISNTEAAE